MSVDATKVIYASTLNAYKNLGVLSESVVVSGAVGAGSTRTWDTTFTASDIPTYFTIIVEATSFTSSTLRWQTFPPARYRNVTCSGPSSLEPVQLAVLVDGSDITFRAKYKNPYGSTLTFTSTDIDFIYVPYTITE